MKPSKKPLDVELRSKSVVNFMGRIVYFKIIRMCKVITKYM